VSAEVDEFGIRKIYPSWAFHEPWVLGKGNWKTRADFDEASSSDENGSLILNCTNYGSVFPPLDHPGRGRTHVYAIPPFGGQDEPPFVTETDQSKLRSRGYMGTPKDWKNVEITLYGKVNGVGASLRASQFALAARTARHGGFRVDECEGTALYAVLDVEGRASLGKELAHVENGGYAVSSEETFEDRVTNNLMHRWIGMKGIFYNKSNGNPKLELWLDKDANNDWGDGPVIEYEDDGNWSLPEGEDNVCGGYKNEKITWGSPIVLFRWDYLTDVDIKYASVREIVPPYALMDVWESLGGVLTSGPGASSWASNRLDVFVRGTDNALWHKWFDGRWFDWESLGGGLTSDPAAVSWGNGGIDVLLLGTENE
jgi:hypothetical protein